MSTSVTSYVCSVLLATHSPTHGLTAGQRHWRRLAGAPSDSYRPELHYMRGPGPKWREKHRIAAAPGRRIVALTRRPILDRFMANETSRAQRKLADQMVETCR
jgi:hypothetical protein